MDANLILGVTDSIQSFFASVFGENAWLATILISFVPLIELKGGILFGSSSQFWGDSALTKWQAYLCGLLSGLIIIVVLTFALKPLFAWLKRTKTFKKLALRAEKSFKKRADKIDAEMQVDATQETAEAKHKLPIKRMLGIMLFVAIPLPLTGVWTGTAIAVFLDLKWWQSILATFAGDVIAGAIIAGVSVLLDEWLNIAFYAIFFFAIIVLLLMVAKMVIDSIREKKAAKTTVEDATEDIEPDNSNTEKTEE